MRLFLCLCPDAPIFRATVLYPLRRLRNGGSGGQPSGWPVPIVTGISTPVWATTLERGNSGGSCKKLTMEFALMATVLNSPYPQFVFVFAAVRRCERQQHIHMLRTVAADERAARLSLARDYVLSFAARLPVQEVRA